MSYLFAIIIFSLFSLYYFMNVNRYFVFLTILPILISTIFYSLIMYYEFYCIYDYDYEYDYDYDYKNENNYNCSIVKSFILNAPSFFSDKFIIMYICILLLNVIYLILNGIILLFRIFN